MLEILAIVFMCRSVHRTLKAEGATAWPFVVLTVVLWLGFEFAGALIAAIATYDAKNPGAFNPMVYVVALISAVCGGVLGILIARLRAKSVRGRREAEGLRAQPMIGQGR